jgi:hypothetical protein
MGAAMGENGHAGLRQAGQAERCQQALQACT